MTEIDSDKIAGNVFHIVHGSFVDGHGIRTTVFLKGCPLRCLWCCNPEGQKTDSELRLTISKCNQCGRCVTVCEPAAITLIKGSTANIQVDRGRCTNCGKCIDVCFTGALELFGETMTVERVYGIVAKDREYYNRSGGGVTIGGGEPTLQADFAYALMKKCQDSAIHVAIDTCGYTRTTRGLQILEEADLLLYDIKGMDAEEHRANTGVSNVVALENLARLGEMGRAIIIRMALIPGYNDSQLDIVRAAEFLSRHKSIERVDLIPYHKFGTIKYEQLGKDYRLGAVQSPAQERVDEVKRTFESYGLTAQIGG